MSFITALPSCVLVWKLAYNFWIDPNNSRPYGSKNDMKRVRIGPKQFSKHPIYIYMYIYFFLNSIDFKNNDLHGTDSNR
jgi:hypothetical protein